jgi:hypothetical protein
MEHPMNGHQMKGVPSPIGKEVTAPEQRSWAQIRKDVERAVLNSNNHNNDGQTPARMSQAEKTDDGETSGEESK